MTEPDVDPEKLEALIDAVGGLTLAQVAELLGRLVSRLDELALDQAIEEIE